MRPSAEGLGEARGSCKQCKSKLRSRGRKEVGREVEGKLVEVGRRIL